MLLAVYCHGLNLGPGLCQANNLPLSFKMLSTKVILET